MRHKSSKIRVEHESAPLSLPTAAHRSAQGEVCQGCGFIRPMEEFEGVDVPITSRPEDTLHGFELRCRRCRTEGGASPAMALEDIGWEDVNPRHRALLQHIVLQGQSFGDAARQIGMSDRHGLGNVLRKSAATRRAFRALLVAMGFDPLYLAQKVRVLANAQRPAWNNATSSWDYFPDNAVQARMVELGAKLYDLLPERQKAPPNQGAVVLIQTNIDTKHDHPGVESMGAMVLDVIAEPTADDTTYDPGERPIEASS